MWLVRFSSGKLVILFYVQFDINKGYQIVELHQMNFCNRSTQQLHSRRRMKAMYDS
jgi:hypothetical protein